MRALLLLAAVVVLSACGSKPPGSTDGGTGGAGGTGGGASGGGGGSDGGGSDGGGSGGGGGSAGGGGGSGGGGGAGGGATGHALQTVFVIVMENQNWSSIKGSTSAPYINDTLLKSFPYATQYKNPPGLHPSEPNYIWLEAGHNFGITSDDDPASNHQSSTAHLVTQLEAAGVSWTSYQEDIDAGSCPLTSIKLYAAKHNPMVFFDDVTDTNSPTSARCIAHMKPYSSFSGDLSGGAVARYNFVTPNLCHDMHGEIFGTTCPTAFTDMIKMGDDWLSTEVPKILASSAYQDGGVLFITWDEGEGSFSTSDGPIGMIVISPLARDGGYSNAIAYDHSSTLKTVQEIFGVTPLLGGAGDPATNDLSDFFIAFP